MRRDRIQSVFQVLRLSLIAIVTSIFVQTAKAEERRGVWESAKHTVASIAEDGDWDLYLSGYAHHSRSTYTDKRIRKLNEFALGGGFGKTLRNEAGNDQSLYVMVLRDSHRRPQWMAGYAYQWMYPVGESGLEFGAGISALLMRRSDWFEGWPFPAVLPVFSMGLEEARLMATYVPKLSTRKGKGNVLLLFAKFEF